MGIGWQPKSPQDMNPTKSIYKSKHTISAQKPCWIITYMKQNKLSPKHESQENPPKITTNFNNPDHQTHQIKQHKY